MQLSYSELEDGIRLVRLGGALDLTGVRLVEKKLAGHSAGQNVQMILDLSEVTFLASVGIRLILNTAKSLESRGGGLVLLQPSKSVEEILEVTGITEVIPICVGLEEAKLALLS